MNKKSGLPAISIVSIVATCISSLAFASSFGGATGSATVDNKALIASNGDNEYQYNAALLVVDPNDGYKYIGNQIVGPEGGSRSPWTDMITRGLNEEGLAYTWTYVAPDNIEPDSGEAFGITFEQFGRMVLSQAATVEEAIELVDEYPRAYHGNFLFADASGTMAMLEISTKSYEVIFQGDDGTIGRANSWLSPEMQRLSEASDDMSDSGCRQNRWDELLEANSGSITEQTMMRMASDYEGALEHGWSIESHRCDPETTVCRSASTSSEVISPSDGTFWWNWGWGSGRQPRFPEQQGIHDRSWGVYVPFKLSALKPGEYVTKDSRLTPLAIRYIMNHFEISTPTMEIDSIKGQSEETWVRTQ